MNGSHRTRRGSTTATDVVIVGSGPAGATAATRLARCDVDVTLVHAPRRDSPVGEVMKAAIRPRLVTAGLWDELQPAVRPLDETCVVWGSDDVLTTSGVTDPYGPGWLLDRRAFERVLVDRCYDSRVAVVSAQATDVLRVGGGWRVRLDSGANVSALYLVDATGRSAWVTRRFGRRKRLDDLVAATTVVECGAAPPRMCIISTPTGWHYSLPTFDGRGRVEVTLGDRSTLGESAGRRRSATTALSTWSDDQLVPVGDALMSLDPLSGDGVGFGIVSGEEAATSIVASLTGDRTAIERFRRGAAMVYDRELERRAEAYSAEQRWSDHDFWMRRHRAPAPPRRPHDGAGLAA